MNFLLFDNMRNLFGFMIPSLKMKTMQVTLSHQHHQDLILMLQEKNYRSLEKEKGP